MALRLYDLYDDSVLIYLIFEVGFFSRLNCSVELDFFVLDYVKL